MHRIALFDFLTLNIHGNCIKPRGHGNYLFSVKALSPVFRAKYRDGLKAALAREGIDTPFGLFEQIKFNKWVVYAKESFADPKQGIEYMGRYTHKFDISNHRLTELTQTQATFRYKDYAQDGAQKLMTLENTEFLRRICLHILPSGFVKILHYGFLSSRRKREFIALPMDADGQTITRKKPLWQQACLERMGFDPEKCPCCGLGKMAILRVVKSRAPPAMPLAATKTPAN